MTRGATRAVALAALAGACLAAPALLWAETREVDPRRVEEATRSVCAARRRIVLHDVERQKRLLLLTAERIEALRLKHRPRADALALQRRLLQQQRRVQALQDREQLRRDLEELRLATAGTPVE